MPNKTKGRKPIHTTPEAKRLAQRGYASKYKKAHLSNTVVSFDKERDADIIQWLEDHKPKQRYIRDLIRRDMEDKGD